ncbi:uncharacterized protein C3orf38 homolog [Ambystoma mexicanum]|uniref:uncharacterized protein C3orf38 homolog n=1 Tax=Ambystoma mexicanum TaxID=8296 RepID=UPI0037E92197
MARLSEREQAGCRELLESLDSADLRSLSDTVTNRLIQPVSHEETIRVILTYSESATELLKRKKVHRDCIFKYLAKRNVIVPPTAEKNQLIQRALEHWQAGESTVKPVTQSYEKKTEEYGPADINLLGIQFCHWFYPLLNSQNPLSGQPKGEWGPQHFWEDAVLKFHYLTSEQNMEEYRGSAMTSLRLLALVREENLLLYPNLDSGGVKSADSPHGLVVVAVAGTVHRGTLCLGIFEQIFGLIRDPHAEHSFKIKFVNLKIVGQKSLRPEALLSKPKIEYNTTDLQRLYS